LGAGADDDGGTLCTGSVSQGDIDAAVAETETKYKVALAITSTISVFCVISLIFVLTIGKSWITPPAMQGTANPLYSDFAGNNPTQIDSVSQKSDPSAWFPMVAGGRPAQKAVPVQMNIRVAEEDDVEAFPGLKPVPGGSDDPLSGGASNTLHAPNNVVSRSSMTPV
jgi:hypothetical protein